MEERFGSRLGGRFDRAFSGFRKKDQGARFKEQGANGGFRSRLGGRDDAGRQFPGWGPG